LQHIKSHLFLIFPLVLPLCDIDIEKPRELIKLFGDWDVMEFVLKRYYDNKMKSDQFGGMFAMINGELWNGHDVIESARYLEDKARFAV
jgi:hypothetical protein